MRRIVVSIIVFIGLALSLASCYPTRNVPEGSYLYGSNSYKIKDGKIASHNLNSYYLQNTNQSMLFLRPSLWFYDFGTRFKDSSKVNRFFTQTLGEPPIIYDSTLIDDTWENMQQHLKNLGYYNAEVIPIITKSNYYRTVKVKYVIIPHKPYLIRDVKFDIVNRRIRSFVLADWGKSPLDTGRIFSVNLLQQERDRITKDLRNLGYYYFSKKQIAFEADSALSKHEVSLKLQINELSYTDANYLDSIIYIKDKQYKFNKVIIYPEIATNNTDQAFDTTIVSYDFDNRGELDFYFIHNGSLEVNPKAILQAIFIKPDHFYKQDDVAHSYKALFNLNIYKYINVNIKDLKMEKDGFGQLNCIIQLSKMSKYSISSDSEVKNTGGDLGIEQGFGIVSRNTFKNGEILSVSLRGALEVQNVTNSENPNEILKIFNTFEAGINTSLELPRFLAPVSRNFFSRYFNPKTKLELGYNYQDRPDYTRIIVNSNFGYRWTSSIDVSHILNPFELASVKIDPEPEFQKIIDAYQDPRIKYSYQDHLVLGMSYSYTYKERNLNIRKPFKFFFGKVELGGIPYNFISKVFGQEKDSQGQNWIGDLPFTQFIRFQSDFRYYLPASNGNLMHVFRASLGVGVPLGGSVAVPFEKSFYIGGANSLRAWTLGTLGPGSYTTGSKTFEMTGDIKIELNYEFRFPITGSIKGAIFTDVGNIYLLKESDAIPGGAFHFYNFYEKLAANIGYGLRYDLSFLVIRFDVANPIYQPYLTKGNRWSMLTTGTDPRVIWAFNFAIGYPF